LYIHNNEKVTGPHAGLGFDIAGVETFSKWWPDHRLEFPVSVVLQEISSASWQPALLMNECQDQGQGTFFGLRAEIG